MQLVAGGIETLFVGRIHKKDHHIGRTKVMPPQWSNLVAPTNVPYRIVNATMRDRFDVKANGGNRHHHLTHLELVQCGRASGGVQAQKQNLPVGDSEHVLDQFANDGCHGEP